MIARVASVALAAIAFLGLRAEVQTVDVKIQSLSDYNGIDVSKHQGRIDWHTISRNKKVEFVYLKATEGATYVSPVYYTNLAEAKRNKIHVGCYHFYRTTSGAYEQFENFKAHVKAGEQQLLPLIDVEKIGNYGSQRLVDSLTVFLRLVEKHYKVRPMLYTYQQFYNNHLAGSFTKYPLFIAKYSDEEPQLIDNAKATLWQFSDRGSMVGINGRVDLDKFVNGCTLNDILVNKYLTIHQDASYSYMDNLADPSKVNLQAPTDYRDWDESKYAGAKNTMSKEERERLKKDEKARKKLEKQREKERKEQEKREQKLMKELRKKAQKDPEAAQQLQELLLQQAERKNAGNKHDNTTVASQDDTSDPSLIMPTRSRKK